jgi:hypothetical protein
MDGLKPAARCSKPNSCCRGHFQTAGVVNLTTVLAHTSGEWIASDWPVCAVADTATPRRMGAALTYARRYALFTLVGIAGEDDVDAPDLITPRQQSSESERSKGGSLNGGKLHAPYPEAGRSAAKVSLVPGQPALGLEASAQLRDRLLGELNELASGDETALWAHRSLPEKNKLTTTEAQRVEQAFQAKMATFVSPPAPKLSGQTEQESKPHRSKTVQPTKRRSQAKGIDKSTLLLAEPRRIRDREHVRYVAGQPCLICGRSPSDRIICASPNPGHSVARSAMSSPCPCVEGTIARYIAVAMKPRGGGKPCLIRPLLPAHCGSKRIRW